MPIKWTDEHTCFLIDECKSRNEEYYKIAGRKKIDFWNNIAKKINNHFRTIYTSYQAY